MQTDLWKITCEEHLYPGLWQRWFRSQSVALGWPPRAGFHLDGSGVRSHGWTIARKALARIKPGDHIFVTLRGSRIARLGTVTGLAVQDSEWNPFIPPSRTEKHGQKGRRIHVRWHLELGPDDREQVVELPPGFRLKGAQLRTTLSIDSGQTSITNEHYLATLPRFPTAWRTAFSPILLKKPASVEERARREWMSSSSTKTGHPLWWSANKVPQRSTTSTNYAPTWRKFGRTLGSRPVASWFTAVLGSSGMKCAGPPYASHESTLSSTTLKYPFHARHDVDGKKILRREREAENGTEWFFGTDKLEKQPIPFKSPQSV